MKKAYALLIILMIVATVVPLAFAANGALVISDHEWTVDGNKKSGTTVTARPGDKIKIKIKAENQHTSGGADIEDVVIDIIWDAFNDDEDDLEDDDVKSRIRPQGDTSFTFENQVPLLVSEGEYGVDIKVEGKNETNNFKFTDELTLTVDVNKRRHELQFDRIEFTSDSITCATDADFLYKLVNTGEEDEDITLTITNTQLGVSYSDQFEILNGDDSDAVRQQTVKLDLPESRSPGSYIFNIKADYGNNDINKQATLTIAECPLDTSDGSSTDSTGQTTKTADQTTTVTQPTQPAQPTQPLGSAQAAPITVTTSTNKSGSGTLIALIVLGYLVVIAVIIALVFVLRRKK